MQPSIQTKTVQVSTPYKDQKPGTSGLRKKVKVFQQPHYLENFVQSIFNSLPKAEYQGKTLVVSGDGRFYNDVATQTIIQIAVSNGVKEIVVGQHCLLSTPAVSALIRKLNEDNGGLDSGYCFGGIVLSASHNPGGPNEDFGIKFNGKNGGPALENVTEEIFAQSLKITEYTLLEGYQPVDTSTVGETILPRVEGSLYEHSVNVIDNSEFYVELMKKLFDFGKIKKLINRKDFSMCFDGMHGVAGPYAHKIFGDIFGVEDLMRCNVLPDFGGGHPDPNLTYAADLVAKMGVDKPNPNAPIFGAACDGDADRNMILGRGFFVTPSDSVAIIVANHKDIPYLAGGISGAARSMPTSGALDKVTAKLGIGNYETPTGWKFFGNLLDSEKIHICGEESFGTGSSHVREKDGVWAVLCWLQILAARNEDPSKALVTVEDIVREHWQAYGRNYYRRYDYEGLETEAADKVFAQIESQFGVFEAESEGNSSTNFTYNDPVDGSVSKNQGYIFKYKDGSRFVFRKSGTGSSGATIRVYLEKYSEDPKLDVNQALKEISDRALSLSQLHELTGRKAPTVIT
uniref:phosphoglucomutase (alpha-D-glucose-1,6-bisphosphate-dependent) n=1 Tax=Strombidium rassoulzadegani TaxID=1082188 RepID=A0A7S3CRG0_9SPIT|mmetsp:Transcript_4390/g.7431  ORF Transcript_4390/g.7431 Transcript_4390/m.7431 type:complete len:572 (+) Transcript_4390:54-1769(+)